MCQAEVRAQEQPAPLPGMLFNVLKITHSANLSKSLFAGSTFPTSPFVCLRRLPG